jgi:hypothetical protein
VDAAPVKALARAFRYQRLLDEGRYASISEMAAAEKIERGYLGRLLRLTLLAPDIVEAILDGRHSGSVQLNALLKPFPIEWRKQAAVLHSPKQAIEAFAEHPKSKRKRSSKPQFPAENRA